MSWRIDNVISNHDQINVNLDVTYDGSNVIVLKEDSIKLFQLRSSFILNNDNFNTVTHESFNIVSDIDISNLHIVDILWHDSALYSRYNISPIDGSFSHLRKFTDIYAMVEYLSNNDKNVELIELPEVMNSNIASINGNLWLTSKNNIDERQSLYKFNTRTKVFTSNFIPSAKQHVPRFIAGDYKDNILVTCFNNSAISKHDADGLFISNIGVSPSPYFIKTMEDRSVWVGSTVIVETDDSDGAKWIQWEDKDTSPKPTEFKTSIITKINTDTDIALDRYSIQGELSGLIDFQNSLWYTSDGTFERLQPAPLEDPPLVPPAPDVMTTMGFKHLGRLNLSDRQIYRTDAFTFVDAPPEDDLTANNVDLPLDWTIHGPSEFIKSIKLQAYTYDYWNGTSIVTRSIPEFVLTLTPDLVFGFVPGKLYTTRESFIHGTAMISKTIYDLTGDL